jgi:uncharacterized protein
VPVNPSDPGVYGAEIAAESRAIRGVATAVAAFVGIFRRGLQDWAVRVLSLADFERDYGDPYDDGDGDGEASHAVRQFFLNGGTEAWVIRVGHPGPDGDDVAATAPATAGLNAVVGGAGPDLLEAVAGRVIHGEPAANPGAWGNALRLEVTHDTSGADTTFTLAIREVAPEGGRLRVVHEEVFRNLTNRPNRANTAIDVVNAGSRLVFLRAGPSPLTEQDVPHPTGTLGRVIAPGVDFAGARPTVSELTGIAVTVQFGPVPSAEDIGPIALDFSDLVSPAGDPASMADWAALFEARLRRAALDPAAAVPVDQRAYLSGAVVALLGAGSAAEPWRFHIRAGQGARPFRSEARLRFSGATVGAYGLNGAVSEGPQQITLSGGADGTTFDPATGACLVPSRAFVGSPAAGTGLHALEAVDHVTILCIPDAARLGDVAALALYGEALGLAMRRRAMLIVDIPQGTTRPELMESWLGRNAGLRAPNAVVSFPRICAPDPLLPNRLRSFASSGTLAGLWARTDAQRGVWKAPAGTDASLRGVQQLDYTLSDEEIGALTRLGVNCLRRLPIHGHVCWGARTMDGADAIASDWKYVPVRRTALFIEESLQRGTHWAVFEPNGEPLWARIRLSVGAFMHDLFRQGAFRGATPSDAFVVKCDASTTTRSDIDDGIVTIVVGFAPLRPAEFVILTIQQKTFSAA